MLRVGRKYQRLITQSACDCCNPKINALTRRIEHDLSRRGFIASLSASFASAALPNFALAQSTPVPSASKRKTYLTNVTLFDGSSSKLRENMSICVADDKIIDVDFGTANPTDGSNIIDCGRRFLMPGLIDAHWHAMMAPLPLPVLLTADVGYIHLAASAQAERTLMRGFTTVRDMAGPTFALKKAIDSGLISGPRIYPSGAIITQTGGHGDFRLTYETPRTGASLTRSEIIGFSTISDGPDAVRRATREQLMAGATQIKIAAGGGIVSFYDPIDVAELRPEEIRAAAEAASDWGTYVAAHVYLPAAIRRCVDAGVRSIEHGHLTDIDTAKILADKGVWWSVQPFLDDEDATYFPVGSINYEKQRQVTVGTENAYRWAREFKIKTAWGTDILFDEKQTERQGAQLVKLQRWYSSIDVLRQATSLNAEILKMSGNRDGYGAKLGVIEKGAYADMILVDGDPTSKLSLIADPEKNFKIIMKGGKIHKNTL